ncbi:MAG: type III pantothenate kinase [Burkholderiaceae bacterium]
MLLIVDAGNTRIKWAVARDSDRLPSGLHTKVRQAKPQAVERVLPLSWIAQGAVTHDEMPRLRVDWQSYRISAVIVANVAGHAIEAALRQHFQALVTRRGTPATVQWFASSAAVAGVRNDYREPARLGCDRLATLIGAHALWPGQALIVATCGTATTIDALTADGRFIGGLILPGLAIMAASLAQSTAQLSDLQQAPHNAIASSLFADNTDDAIRQGCLAAQVGAIECAVARHTSARCVLSGGAAHKIAPYLAIAPTVVDNLVLIGLEEVVRNKGGGQRDGHGGRLELPD